MFCLAMRQTIPVGAHKTHNDPESDMEANQDVRGNEMEAA